MLRIKHFAPGTGLVGREAKDQSIDHRLVSVEGRTAVFQGVDPANPVRITFRSPDAGTLNITVERQQDGKPVATGYAAQVHGIGRDLLSGGSGGTCQPFSRFVIPSDSLLEHWQGHRRVTRRVIEAFPEDAFFRFSIGGMRPFSGLATELLSMASAGIQGLATRQWTVQADLIHHKSLRGPTTRAEFLRRWDEVTRQIDTLWPQIPPQRFQEVDKVFGEYEGPVYGAVPLLDRQRDPPSGPGPGVRLPARAGIEPPAFYDRS